MRASDYETLLILFGGCGPISRQQTSAPPPQVSNQSDSGNAHKSASRQRHAGVTPGLRGTGMRGPRVEAELGLGECQVSRRVINPRTSATISSDGSKPSSSLIKASYAWNCRRASTSLPSAR